MVDIPRSVIDTLIAEAAGEGDEGMRRVAETILNRAAIRGLTPDQVVQQPNQYTGYWSPGAAAQQAQNNPAVRAAAEQAYRLALEPGDPTGGADHYYAPGTISQPSWARSMTPTGNYGGHSFYASRPIPPGEIPNTVASALSVRPPAPVPAQQSPDLSLMRNPLMSSAARMAQVTPPLPQRRPASPMDIARAPGTTVATIPTSNRPGQSQIERITPMPSARDIAMAPGQTIATIPTTQRVSLPALPPSNIGHPPITRTVPSVPYNLQPTAREIAEARGTTIATIPTTGTPRASQINQAARRAALTVNQSNVERNPAPRPIGSSALNIADQRAEQLSQRPPASARLAPGPIGLTPNTNGVRLNQPPIQVVPSPYASPAPVRFAPTPMAAGARPTGPLMAQASPPRMGMPAVAPSPLRVTVNGANSYSAPPMMTSVQRLQSQGMSPSQAYDAANASARGSPSLEERVTGGTSSGDSGSRLVAMNIDPSLIASLVGSSGYRYG